MVYHYPQSVTKIEPPPQSRLERENVRNIMGPGTEKPGVSPRQNTMMTEGRYMTEIPARHWSSASRTQKTAHPYPTAKKCISAYEMHVFGVAEIQGLQTRITKVTYHDCHCGDRVTNAEAPPHAHGEGRLQASTLTERPDGSQESNLSRQPGRAPTETYPSKGPGTLGYQLPRRHDKERIRPSCIERITDPRFRAHEFSGARGTDSRQRMCLGCRAREPQATRPCAGKLCPFESHATIRSECNENPK